MEEEVSNEAAHTIGGRLRQARRAAHLSQDSVALFLGVKRMAVTNWESARNFPSLENVVMVAGLYGTTVDWLAWGDSMASGIEGRLRKIPKALRAALVQRLHREIDKTEELADRLPPEMRGPSIDDNDVRLKEWSARNKIREARRKRKAKADTEGTQ